MSRRRLVAAVLLAAFFTFTASSCKTSNQNSNQQANNPPKAKVGKWVAQWQASGLKDVPLTYVALFSYSCISVVSADVIFAAGDIPAGNKRVGIFVRTTDGGKNWTETRIERPDIAIPVITAIHFINATTGWLAGLNAKDEGVVLKTVDAGANWEVSQLKSKQRPTSIFFVDENSGWLGGVPALDDDAPSENGPSDLLVTNDGGKTWAAQRRLPIGVKDMQFIDKTNGWLVGQKGAIYKTNDGGRTWDTQRSELEPGEGSSLDLTGEGSKKFGMGGVSFADANNGFAVAMNEDRNQGRVLGTGNGGTSWSKKLIGADEGYRDIFCISALEAWVVPNSGRFIYYTADGGRYWNSEPVTAAQDVPFFRIAGTDAMHVWAVAGGAIYHRVVE
jgi:photosystem II stability/assembly factor-like uncharacterized protein